MAKARDLRQHPMRQVCDAWLAKIKLALQVRHEKFGQWAEEISKFYDGNNNWMWENQYSRGAGGFLDKEGGVLPTFRVTVNEVFEAVALFGPALYHKNPNVLVEPIVHEQFAPEVFGIDQNDMYGMQEYQALAVQEDQASKIKQACASIKSRYLNWVQRETDKKTHARRAIQEAIVTGLGYMETTIYQPPSGEIVMPRSTYISWNDVVVDPDASYWEDVQWIAIRRYRPVNLTERRFQLEDDTLKGHVQSFDAQSSPRAKKEAKENRRGKSFDLVEYWEVFSKNGFGDRLAEDVGGIPKKQMFDWSSLGDYCWLAVGEGIPYPLNCPSEVVLEGDAQEVVERVAWPVQFWKDQDGWPISRLTFYEKENCVWPISLFKPCLGEIRFLNWCMSFLADKVAASCHTYLGVMKAAGATIQKQLSGTSSPFTVVEIQEALGFKSINEAVSFLQAPDFQDSIWKMLAEVAQKIKEKTGVTELLQGLTSHSMRSAAEAQMKNERVSVRPDDMAARNEDFLGEVAVREIQTMRWFCEVKDVEPAIGRMGALVYQNHVMTANPDDVVMNFNYTIEAGSTQKPNKQTKVTQLNELGRSIIAVVGPLAQAGQPGPYNAYITEVCKAMDLDSAPFLIQPPEQNGPSPEEQEVQAQIELKVAELNIKIEEMRAKLGMEAKAQEQELEHEKEMHQLELSQKKEELKFKERESKAKAQAVVIAARNKPKPKAGAK
jgi:hypothetical protein